ncbi:CotH protein [Roseivirga ehrenbergii]|uniref:Spore coat protein n=1 Tax=Roseivirga ehrenbergii (strain DSM 102268 / JCM 13514 / KCTC 12282 / NCIMB 14502 / KMM 6017) TaxID=279360 RepID=A0A150XPG7_ROSEK|nr:CotH kinase family protein [Roseivirga ehrenbergii]KYG80630.1 spore coat protein [Roseivirga ehrenbergii]TCL07878.1 CotH protein [Roseivirga ehrenbergii]
MAYPKEKFLLKFSVALLLILSLFFVACGNDDDVDFEEEVVEEVDDTDFIAADWTTETHSNDADPNFDEVFEDNAVKRLDIVITPTRWQSMLDDMTSLYGTFGTRSGGSFSDDNPIFVPAEVFYEGTEWYRVGVRFKGNSSLQSTWQSGNLKLSFKLDFDEFEDDYPQIKNQRFYGFKKLSLKNNYDDKSMLREKVAADVFKNAGLASSHTAFYTVYVDHGDGPTYFGLYTLVEEVDDTLIDTQFDDNDGNLYQPDGDGASFAAGTFSESVFVKDTNEDDADWSDIQSLFTILHDDTRTSDPAAWRANLEAVFDTDVFLKYLATNTVIQNWDTYGRMTHNYFLYNNPDNNLLTWIPWDNNEALQDGKMQGSLELDFSDLSAAEWPLIGYLYADETYKAKYDAYMKEVVDGAFNATTMQTIYTNYAALIESYATTEISGHTFLNSSSEFQTAVNQLKSHATQRASAVSAYLR